MDLSVVIVNWNTADLLRRCLSALEEARRELDSPQPRAVEVIVVDNASADESAAMVRRDFPGVELIANSTNLNYAAASNQALRLSQGEYTLLLNPDTELPSGALPALLRFLEERPAAGAVAPRLVHPDGRTQRSVRGFPTASGLIGDLTGMRRLLPGTRWASYRSIELSPAEPARVDQPMASCLLLRRRALEEVGGFDEQFPLFFNDVDLCYRLRQAGWEVWYDPRMAVLHHGGASTRQVRPGAVWQSHLGLIRFFRKHYRSGISAPAWGALCGAVLAAGGLRSGWAWITASVRRTRPQTREADGRGDSH